MTTTPFPWDNQYTGRIIKWTICSGTGNCEELYSPEFQLDAQGQPIYPTAVWDTVYANLIGENLLNGWTIAGDVYDRVLDPDWDPNDYDPLDESTWRQAQLIPVNHVNVSTQIVTTNNDDDWEYNVPNINLFGQIENNPDNPIDPNWPYWSLCGFEDGSYYVYPVVFPDAKFCYLPACSGTYNFEGEQCVEDTGWFPLEPYDPTADPPIYPLDTVTSFVPSSQTERLFEYEVTFIYRTVDENHPDFGTEQTATLQVEQTVLAPTYDWAAMLETLMSMTYFGNGIYH